MKNKLLNGLAIGILSTAVLGGFYLLVAQVGLERMVFALGCLGGVAAIIWAMVQLSPGGWD